MGPGLGLAGCGVVGRGVVFGPGFTDVFPTLFGDTSVNLDLLSRVVTDQAGYYREMLVTDPRARSWLMGRGVDNAEMRLWGIGWCPFGRTPASEWGGYDPEVLTQAGIIGPDVGGKAYDIMEGRVVFPLTIPTGDVVGFLGRDTGSRDPKYANTTTTPICRRREVLMGSHLLVPDSHSVVVTEGPLDAILMRKAGYNAVAIGTAHLSRYQALLIRRYTSRIVLALDNDPEGRKGTRHAWEQYRGLFESMVRLTYPERYDDPADWVVAGCPSE